METSAYLDGHRAGTADAVDDRVNEPVFYCVNGPMPAVMRRTSTRYTDHMVAADDLDYARGYLDGYDSALDAQAHAEVNTGGQSEAQNELQRILIAAGMVPGDCPALITALERDRIVAVLDGWAVTKRRNVPQVQRMLGGSGWSILVVGDNHDRVSLGSTPDEARTKAALAIEKGEV